MTSKILGSLLAGILTGFFLLPQGSLGPIQSISDWALALLLLTVGYELGLDQDLGKKIKELPKTALVVPGLIAIGSILGAGLVSFFLRLSPLEGSLVGSGFGWYSLSAVIIAQTYDVSLGALALLSNIFREVLAILIIPCIAKKIGHIAAIAPGGATTMDVTLPVISQNTDAQTTLIAFYSGTVLTALVPIVVPLIIRLLQNL